MTAIDWSTTSVFAKASCPACHHTFKVRVPPPSPEPTGTTTIVQCPKCGNRNFPLDRSVFTEIQIVQAEKP